MKVLSDVSRFFFYVTCFPFLVGALSLGHWLVTFLS